MSKHTPGPWMFAGNTVESLADGPRDVPFIHIEAEGFDAGGGICMVHDKGGGVGRANSRLIAAAPELFEFVQQVAVTSGPNKARAEELVGLVCRKWPPKLPNHATAVPLPPPSLFVGSLPLNAWTATEAVRAFGDGAYVVPLNNARDFAEKCVALRDNSHRAAIVAAKGGAE